LIAKPGSFDFTFIKASDYRDSWRKKVIVRLSEVVKLVVLMMRSFLAILVAFVTTVSSFQPRAPFVRHGTEMNGIFDGFIKSMEAGYVGGDDSAFAKQKRADEQKRAEKLKQSEERKKRGFTELKDVKGKTFAKTKYDLEEEKEDPIKKFFGGWK